MNKKILSIIAVSACLSVHGQSNVYLQTNFDSGIPSDFILIDNDEAPVDGSVYQNVDLKGSWSANQIETKSNFAAFSFSRYSYDLPSDNWMITPSLALNSDQVYLKWDAKSVHYDHRENYKIMISTTGTDLKDFKEIYAIEKESYLWKTHVVSLAAYAHKNIYVAFVCTSKKQFILAIDNLYVGELSDIAFDTVDESKRFSGDTGTAPVQGSIRNTGKAVGLKKINCISAKNKYSQICENVLLQPDEELKFSFQIPVTVNKVSGYRLEAELEDGSVYTLHEDSIICSYYPRTFLAEKATATWCNNCPAGNMVSNHLKDRFSDEAIIIEVHSNDPFQCPPYIAGISRWLLSYPSFIYNREKENVQSSMTDNTVIKKALLSPTVAKVDIQVERSTENDSLLTIHTQTEFAKEYENASGLYKIGYAIISKSVKGYPQNNSSTLLMNGEYYFLPNTISGDVYVYHNVSREGSTAFQGVQNSLPSQIEAKTEYQFIHSLTIPQKFAQSDDLFVVAFVMNTLTGAILNAARADVPSSLSGIESTNQKNDQKITVFRDGETSFGVHFMEQKAYTIDLFDLDGRIVDRKMGMANVPVITVEYPHLKGFYLMKISQLNHSITKKIILY